MKEIFLEPPADIIIDAVPERNGSRSTSCYLTRVITDYEIKRTPYGKLSWRSTRRYNQSTLEPIASNLPISDTMIHRTEPLIQTSQGRR